MNHEAGTQPSKELGQLGRLAVWFLWVVFLGVTGGTVFGVMFLGISFFQSPTGKTYISGILHPSRQSELRKLKEELDALRYERHLRESLYYQLQHKDNDTPASLIKSPDNITEELLKLDVSIHRLEYKIRQLGEEPQREHYIPPNPFYGR
jgi:hypothetical protein